VAEIDKMLGLKGLESLGLDGYALWVNPAAAGLAGAAGGAGPVTLDLSHGPNPQLSQFELRNCKGVAEVVLDGGERAVNGVELRVELSQCDHTTNLRVQGKRVVWARAIQCTNLREMDCADTSMIDLPEFALVGCRKLSVVKLPPALIGIERYAFFACSALLELKIPGGVMYIGGAAFKSCNRLHTAALPLGLLQLGPDAFAECALRHVVLPGALVHMGNGVFSDCIRLESVDMSAASPGDWMDDADLPDPGAASRVALGDEVFRGCTALHTVKLPGLTHIGVAPFKGCTALRTIALPPLVGLGMHAFQSSGLVSVDLSTSKLRSVPTEAFDKCYALAKVALPPGATHIEKHAFRGCLTLTSWTSPSSTSSNSTRAPLRAAWLWPKYTWGGSSRWVLQPSLGAWH